MNNMHIIHVNTPGVSNVKFLYESTPNHPMIAHTQEKNKRRLSKKPPMPWYAKFNKK